MMRMVLAFSVLLGLQSATRVARAEVTELPSVGESSIVVISRADRQIAFSIRPGGGAWMDQSIPSGHSVKIACNECSTSEFEIKIGTNGKTVDYKLPSGQRFTIEWNDGEHIWDIFHVPE